MLPSTWHLHENDRGSCTRSFLRPPYVRDFVKEGYFFAPWYEVWGGNPITIHEIYAALTPSDSRSDWASVSLLAVMPLNTKTGREL